MCPNAADELVDGDGRQDEPCGADEPAPRGPAEDVARRLLRVASRRAGAGQDLDRDHAHQRVDDAAAERAEALDAAVGSLTAVAEERPEQPPERVSAQPDREQREQDVTERALLDGSQGALLVRDLAAVPDDQLEREQADDPVDERTRHETGPRENREERRVDESLAGRAGAAERQGIRLRRCHCASDSSFGRQIVIAAGCTSIVKDLTFSRSPPSIS